MLFNSFDFLLFFLVVLAGQRVLPHRPRNLFLLAASYLFYGTWDWRFLSLILVSTMLDYSVGRALGRTEDERKRKALVTASLVGNLGILGFFKYAGFFVDSAGTLLAGMGLEVEPWTLQVVLPVGISFYTFQTLSYTIDVYRREMEPVHDPLDFALFVAFFPQLVAGPIERAKHLLPQLTSKPVVRKDQFALGGWLVFWGLFKKAVIADNLALIVDQAYASSATASGAEVLIATYAFAFQIYADFSGYTDIARGVAKMMGYELMLNFRLPYLATSPQDFWHRWHVSLSTWLRDYLYIPLGGSRRGTARTYANLMITMLLGGLWHGAGWTFVIWGAFHGGWLALHRFMSRRGMLPSPTSEWGRWTWWVVRVVATFHLVCAGWLIFRAESMAQFMELATALVRDFRPALGVDALQWAWTLVFVCTPLVLVQLLQARTKDLAVVLRLSPVTRGVVYATLLVGLLAFGAFGQRQFIYFQF